MSFRRFHLHDVPQQRKGWGGEQNFTILLILIDYFCLQLLANRQRAAPTRKHLTLHKSVTEITVCQEKKTKGSSLVRFDELSHAVAVVVVFLYCANKKKKKKADFYLVREKQTLISPTNTGVDEGTETGITQLAPSGKQWFPRDTISAPFRRTLEFKLSSACKMQPTWLCLLPTPFRMLPPPSPSTLNTWIFALSVQKGSAKFHFILSPTHLVTEIPRSHPPPPLNHVPDPAFIWFSEHGISNKCFPQ